MTTCISTPTYGRKQLRLAPWSNHLSTLTCTPSARGSRPSGGYEQDNQQYDQESDATQKMQSQPKKQYKLSILYSAHFTLDVHFIFRVIFFFMAISFFKVISIFQGNHTIRKTENKVNLKTEKDQLKYFSLLLLHFYFMIYLSYTIQKM